LINPTEETQSNIDGLEYIATLIFCYTVKERIYLRQTSPTGLSADVLELQAGYRTALLKIYTLILEYEARSVVHLTRSRLQRAALDTFKVNDWKALLSKIRESDLTCDHLSHALESEQLQRRFEDQYLQIQDMLRQIHARYEEERRKCHEIFRTTDYQGLKDQNPVKVEGTCEWFLNHPKYQNWLEQSKSSLLWVSADPGCGKSVLSRHLVDLYSTYAGERQGSICYFFFKDNSKLTRSANHALCAILHQFFAQKNVLIRHALTYFDQNGTHLTEVFDDLWELFLTSATDPNSGAIICVLDALDECGEETRLPLIRKLSEFFSDPPLGTTLDFIITSRPYSAIGDAFFTNGLDANSIKLMGENPEEMEEIRNEIRLVTQEKVRLFAELRQWKGIIDDTHVRLQQRLDEIDNRTYLWVALIFPELQKNAGTSRRQVLRIIDTLPRTVSEAYEKILSQSSDHAQARKLLHLVVSAFRPLTIFEAGIVLALEEGDEDLAKGDQIPKETLHTIIRELCGLFINIRDDKIYLVHQTAKEFLQGERGINQGSYSTSIWQNSIHPPESHYIMARMCITYLGFNVFETQPLMTDEENCPISNKIVDPYISNHPFLQYASCYWAMHYNLSKDGHDLLQFSASICNTQSKRCQTWLAVCSVLSDTKCPFKDLEDLSLRCWLGHYDAMEKHLQRPEQLSTNDKTISLLIAESKSDRRSIELLLQHGIPVNASFDQGTVLAHAVFKNDIDIMKLLLEKGAGPNACWNDEPLLHYTLSWHYLEAARLLLVHGADRKVKNHLGQAALHIAIVKRILKDAIFLLDGLQEISQSMEPSHLLMSTPNQAASARSNDVAGLYVRDRYGQTPLDLAAWLGQTEEVKILLRYTEDVNVKDMLGQTPLHGAAIHGDNLEIIELLLKHRADPNIQDREGRTPFYLAATMGKIPAAKLLLENGADINAKDSYGDAAPVPLSLLQHHAGLLQRAIASGNFELTRMLLLRGADINIQDDAGHSELHKAAIGEKLEIFDFLLKYKPDIYLLSKDGNTAMDLAPASWRLHMDFHDLLHEFLSTSPAMMPRLIDQTRRRAAMLSTSFADLDDILMAEHLELLCQWSMPLREPID